MLVFTGQRLPEAWCGLGLLGLCHDEAALALLHWSLWLTPLRPELIPALCALARDAILELTVGTPHAAMALRRLDACGARLALHGLAGHLDAAFHPQHLADFAAHAAGACCCVFCGRRRRTLGSGPAHACLAGLRLIPIAPRPKNMPRRGVKNRRGE